MVTAMVLAAGAAPAAAQAPREPKIWTVTASVGLAMTGGNTETSTFNAGYEIKFDPQTRNVVRSDGLFLRGKTDGELSASRFGFNVRDEFRANHRVFVFGQHQYLRDRFKEIDYLLAPTGGVGVRILDADPTRLSVDAGVGGVWEKNTGLGVRSSGAVTLGQKFSHAVSDAVTVTQSFSGLWKTKDFDDALYVFGAGLAASITARTQVKIEWLDTYKARPPGPDVKKNDVSLILAFVYKQ
jgi:putative salt-induced outer membrane protein YdiY